MDNNFWFLVDSGILVMLSWIGLGWGLHRVLKMGRWVRPHWSIFSASGMAIVLALGGVSNLLRITSTGLLDLVTAVGLVLVALAMISHVRRCKTPVRGKEFLWQLPIVFVGIVIGLSSAASTRLNPGDDELAYMLFPQQMLQSGTLIAPFNMRRMGTYGGHQFLQAQLLAVTESLGGAPGGRFFAAHGNLLDTGLCSILSAGLLWSFMRPRSSTQHALATLMVLLFYIMPTPRENTHAQNSGMFLFLALFPVVKALLRNRTASVRLGIFAGIIAAAIATLRMNFAPAAMIAIGLSAIPFPLSMRSLRPQLILRPLLPIAFMIMFMVPWAIVLMQSSGTPFYPLIKGFQQGPFLESPMVSNPLTHLGWALTTGLFPPIVFLLLPFFVTPPFGRLRPFSVLFVSILVTTMATAWACTNMNASLIYRYGAGLAIAYAFVNFILLLRRWRNLSHRVRCGLLFLLLLAPCIAAHAYSEAFRFSYPALLAPALLVAALGWRQFSTPLKVVIASGLLILLVLGAVRNFHRMSDNSTIFLYFISIAGLAWAAWSTRMPSFNLIFSIIAAALALMGILAITEILGLTLVLSTVVLLGGIAVITWSRGRNHPKPVKLIVAAVAVLTLMISVMNLPFFFDSFGTICFTASIAGLVYVAHRATFPLLRMTAIMALTLLVCSALPSLASLAHYPTVLPLFWLAVGAILLLLQMRSPLTQMTAVVLLLFGMTPLAIEEISGFITAMHSSDAASRLTLHDQAASTTYRAAQAFIPPGAAIFALVAEPRHLDFARNPILQSDFELKFISPPPKLPIHGSVADLRRYWKAIGVRYLMLSYDDLKIQGTTLPVELKNALTDISTGSRVLFNTPSLTVLDLEN